MLLRFLVFRFAFILILFLPLLEILKVVAEKLLRTLTFLSLLVFLSIIYYQFFSNMPKSLLNLININFNCIITHSQNGKQENAKAQLN